MQHRTLLPQKRNQFALSQKQLAELVDCHEGTVCRVEGGERVATLAFALACQVLFGIEPRELFFDLAVEVREDVIARLAEFSIAVDDEPPTLQTPHRALLDEVTAREAGSAPSAC